MKYSQVKEIIDIYACVTGSMWFATQRSLLQAYREIENVGWFFWFLDTFGVLTINETRQLLAEFAIKYNLYKDPYALAILSLCMNGFFEQAEELFERHVGREGGFLYMLVFYTESSTSCSEIFRKLLNWQESEQACDELRERFSYSLIRGKVDAFFKNN